MKKTNVKTAFLVIGFIGMAIALAILHISPVLVLRIVLGFSSLIVGCRQLVMLCSSQDRDKASVKTILLSFLTVLACLRR